MPYHGLDHEPRQPEEVIRWAQYIARPPRIVFTESMDRNDAGILDDLTVSPVRTVVLNPYWRDEISEAGLAHLVEEQVRPEPTNPVGVRAHMYDTMWRLLKTGIFVAVLAVGALIIWGVWVVSR